MRIAVGGDHAGFDLKERVKAHLGQLGYDLVDFGTDSTDSVDYPDIVIPLARAVAAGQVDRGVVMCSNGVGVSITANKIPGVRAALCADAWSARRAREHTDANVLALGAFSTGAMVALDILDAFLAGEFLGGRHQRRLDKINALDTLRSGCSDASARGSGRA